MCVGLRCVGARMDLDMCGRVCGFLGGWMAGRLGGFVDRGVLCVFVDAVINDLRACGDTCLVCV